MACGHDPTCASQACCPLSRRAFTLIELLIVVAVIGILISILLPALGHARKCALLTGELSAGKQFIAAHHLYSNDHSGFVMPGFPTMRMLQTRAVVAKDNTGKTLTGLEGRRFPWRLLEYLDFELGILYRDRATITEQFEGLDYAYAVSVAPRMGLNQAFVGGSSDGDGTGFAFLDNADREARLRRVWGATWFVRRSSDVKRTSELIVFASSHGSSPINGVQLDGYYRVTPPSFLSRRWSLEKPDESSSAQSTGNVSFRNLGKAVAAMVDGHAKGVTWEEAQDMRRWAPTATSPDWVLPPAR